jgi:hypothetical protein
LMSFEATGADARIPPLPPVLCAELRLLRTPVCPAFAISTFLYRNQLNKGAIRSLVSRGTSFGAVSNEAPVRPQPAATAASRTGGMCLEENPRCPSQWLIADAGATEAVHVAPRDCRRCPWSARGTSPPEWMASPNSRFAPAKLEVDQLPGGGGKLQPCR